MYFIGIDLGISYLKICFIDEYGKEKAVFKYKNRYHIDNNFYKEIDLCYLLEKITICIKKIKNKFPSIFLKITSISITTHGSTFMFIDKNGNELTNGISVFDKRAIYEAKIINSIIDPEQNYQVCGHKEHSEIYPAAKILWFKNNKKAVFDRIYKVLFMEDYIIFKLTGKFITDKSIASISGMLDLNKNQWREDILELIELKQNNFPEVIDAGIIVGNISSDFSQKTGLSKKVNVVTGLLDALANSLGSSNINYNKAVECTGTVLSLIVNTPKPKFNQLKIPINYFMDNKYSLLPFSSTAGILIDWFGFNFYNKFNYYNKMENDINNLEPGKNDIIFLPYLVDTSIIHNNFKSRGVFFGIGPNHQKRNFCRSVYESIGFMLKENISVVELIINSKIKEVISTGGASRSEILSQIKSDILNRKIVVTRNSEAGCLGVAILAAVANNRYSNFDDAIKNMIEYKKIFKPNRNYVAIYQERYKKYRDINECFRNF